MKGPFSFIKPHTLHTDGILPQTHMSVLLSQQKNAFAKLTKET